jgi:protein-S-isoprenylcysteine O-methyltransferase Ste14
MPLLAFWYFFYCAWIATEIYIGLGTRTKQSSGTVRDRGTLRLLWLVIAGSLTVGITLGRMSGSDLPGGAPWLGPGSLAVLLAGLLLRWTAVISLGKSFSSNVAIHATQRVHKTGLYRWMRHPSYTGLLLCIYASGLQTRNWIAMLIVALPTTAALLYRIHVEEIALREHFGAEYVDYCARTKRLVPGVF